MSLSATTVSPQLLVPGLNFVCLCIVVTTCALVASMMPAPSGLLSTQPTFQYWVSTHPTFNSPDFEVIPGILDAQSITSHTKFKQSGTSFPDEINIEPCNKQYFTVTINNLTTKELDLPVGLIAQIEPVTKANTQLFHEAAIDTADSLSEEWVDALQCRNLNMLAQQSPMTGRQLRPFLIENANLEMQVAFDPYCFGTLFSCTYPKPILDDDRDIPPINSTDLDPYSKEYQDMVVQTLHLNDNRNLTPNQRHDLDTLVRKYAHIFMLPGAPFRGVTTPEHTIDTGDAPPQYQPPYAKSPMQLQIVKAEIQKMLEQGILEPSSSPWGAPCLLVKKKPENGLPVLQKLVYDYCRLSKVTIPDVYPLPNIETLLNQLGGKSWFSESDLFNRFWHVPVAPKDREKTAVITHVELYQFRRLPFDLRNAPATFQHLMNTTFADMLFPRDEDPYLPAYVDDLLCHSTEW